MRVAVTGGLGKLGRAVVADLREHGHEVLVLDVASSTYGDAATRVDLTDYGQVVGALTRLDDRHDGVDAVVHLAAIPYPGAVPNAALFANNVVATYNVFEACRVAGIRNVVWASSETVLGLPFDDDANPPYLPANEDYPPLPMSAYSLGKALEEEMARHFCRWDPATKLVALRFSNVMEPQDYAAFAGWQDDPSQRSWNAWGYIDARDGAQAVRLALQLDQSGFDVFVIANADSVMERPSADLAAETFPGKPMTRAVEGTQTLLSIEKARRVLGYEPRHSWRDPASR